MDEVLKLVNRLQSACTLLGDTAGQKDSDLPGLWEMLPSIVVIGGQVHSSRKTRKQAHNFHIQEVHESALQISEQRLRLEPQCLWHGWPSFSTLR